MSRGALVKKGQMILLEWEDICDYQNDDWNVDYEGCDTITVLTLCWAAEDLNKRKRQFRVARDFCHDDGRFRSVMAVPTGCIVGIRTLPDMEECWDVSKAD